MILKKLSVLNYKNITQAEAVFSPKMNCFFGNNGMGKTNLLDAIYYLSFCKSSKNTPDSQILRNGEDLCVLQGWYDYEGREEDIFCAIRRRQRKQFRRNKKEYDKLSEHIGLLPIVSPSRTRRICTPLSNITRRCSSATRCSRHRTAMRRSTMSSKCSS